MTFSVLLAVLSACTSAEAQPLKIMSFNIRGDFDLDQAYDNPEAWNALTQVHRRDLVVKTIEEFGPDILSVQEAFRHQLLDLERGLGDYAYYGVGRDDGKAAGEHSAIFYRSRRFGRIKEGSFWLSDTPTAAGSKHPDAANIRIASWVILADRACCDRESFVLNTHWDHVSNAARRDAARLIREELRTLAGDRPVIVTGDLNATEDDAAIATLLGDDQSAELRLHDSFRGLAPERGKNEATYHNFGGQTAGSRIDYILHSAGFRAVDAGIVRTKFDARYPSDHFPVTATLAFSEETSDDTTATAPR